MKRFLGFLATALAVFLACDILLSWGVFLYLSNARRPAFNPEKFLYSPTISLGAHLITNLRRPPTSWSEPAPYNVFDAQYGYGPLPGTYTLFLANPAREKVFRWSARIMEDRSRATAPTPTQGARTLFIYGDSWIFGWGVNDENTFAWHLQDALKDQGWAVRHFAQGGYATIHALIRHRQLAPRLTQDDLIILGYASFYKDRNAGDPGFIRSMSAGLEALPPELREQCQDNSYPRAVMTPDGIDVALVPMLCSRNDGYCDKPAIPEAEKVAVTNAVHDEIIDTSKARVVVLFIDGKSDDPVIHHLRERGVRIVDARPRATEYFVQDSIYGYDDHPGPLFHHYLFTKLRSEIFGE